VKKPKVKEFQKGPQVLLEKKDSAQTHLIMGVRAFPITDKRRHALRVLAGVLGAGMSSRLFRKVREELGAAYYVRASADLYADRGTLAVSVGAEHSKLEAVIVAVCEEFRRITKELVPPAELQKVKDYLTGTFMLGIETSDELANFYAADQVVFGAITSPAQTVREIMAVTPQEVRKVAQAILKNDRLNLALIGPREDGESLRLLLNI
jgi:predicted Zn-dependent peptidase